MRTRAGADATRAGADGAGSAIDGADERVRAERRAQDGAAARGERDTVERARAFRERSAVGQRSAVVKASTGQKTAAK